MGCEICRKQQLDYNDEITFPHKKTSFLSEEDLINNYIKNFEEKLPQFGKYTSLNKFQNEIPNEIVEYSQSNPFKHSNFEVSNLTFTPNKPIEFKNGNLYNGYWNSNYEMEGFGKYILKENNVYIEGIWEKGIFKYGRIYYPNGDIYEGEIQNNLFNGKGKLIHNDGTIFEGEFIDGEKGDYGKIIYNDKSFYQGYLKYGIPNGKGEFKWINGIYYNGNFDLGKIEGRGKIINEISGSSYIGDFKNNIFHGKGKYNFKDGSIYDGNYLFGKKNGEGLYIKKNGIKYDGNFYDGKLHGTGIVEDNNSIYKCTWKNGLVVETPIIENKNNEQNNNLDLNLKIENEDIDMFNLQFLERDNNNDNIKNMSQNYMEFKPKVSISDVLG